MANTLVAPADLADFPGAPFSDAVVDAAAGSVRDEAEWHIAPEVAETVTVTSTGGTVLLLPSLRVVTVTAIRDVTGDAPENLTGWRAYPDGTVERPRGWPKRHRLEVDLTHGYAACPPALLGVIADVAATIKRGGRVTQESLGSRSLSFERGGGPSPLARYKLPPRP